MRLRQVRNALWVVFAALCAAYLIILYAGRKETASAEGEALQGESLEIYVWMDEIQTFDALSRGFMEKYPEVTVNVHYAPTDEYTQSCLERLSDMDTDVDICGFSVPSGAAQMVSSGLLTPLDEWAGESAAMSAIDSLVEQINTYEDGHIYSIPYRNSAWVVYYNKEIFDACSVSYPSGDWTWEDYAEKAEKLSIPSEGVYGSMNFNSSWWRVPARTNGAEYPLNEEDLAEFLRVAEWNYRLTYEEKAATPYDELTTASGKDYISRFLSGEAAMMCGGEWCLSMLNRRIQDEGLAFAYDVAPLPHWEGQEGRAIGSIASLSVAEKSEHKALAWQFLEFASGEEGARILAGLSYLPACDTPEIRTIFRESLSMPEHTEYFFSTERISSFPATNRYTLSMNYLNEEVMAYLMQEKTLEDAVAAYRLRIMDTLGGME